MTNISQQIATELNVAVAQIDAAINLLDEGSTVPFIARYRKEVTQGLDDTQLRGLEQRLGYLRELGERREAVIKAIDEQGKLNDKLKLQLINASSKTELEDLYLPFKVKRRTKAQIAKEAGIEPLADTLIEDPTQQPEKLATQYINIDAGFADEKAVLEGAKQILMERFSENAQLLAKLRDYFWTHAVISSRVVKGQESAGTKFSDYFEYDELISKLPSHRALALLRGRNEGMLQLTLDLPDLDPANPHPCEIMTANHSGLVLSNNAADDFLRQAVRWTWKVKLHTKLEVELVGRLREQAEEAAIVVFAQNLKDLLLAAPAGHKAVLGLDPGLRTGVKVAVVDDTGKLLDTETIYPHAPRNAWDASLHTLTKLVDKHQVKLIAIGNGTASRETDKLSADLLKLVSDKSVSKIVVSEAGASVYSASELAAKEFPDLDVSIRGAVSIARRLQDPLAELVKIDPKSIGVGQYQHDVSQVRLSRMLETVVEDCVNAVGVDVNTASARLLERVSGLNTTVASNIIDFRDANGKFKTRRQLKDVPRLGPKAFELAAGFLRIQGGDNALDASSVHPEAYPIVKKILSFSDQQMSSLIGNSSVLRQLDPKQFIDENFGVPTVVDILKELEKPGRDPRPEFVTASFKEGVEKVSDLKPGMRLEGVVTNVTGFGAFVDIGVHQDGLVHISQLADKFIKDPHEAVSTGDVVSVRVVEVDLDRKRIALSMKSQASSAQAREDVPAKPAKRNARTTGQRSRQKSNDSQPVNSAMADALQSMLK